MEEQVHGKFVLLFESTVGMGTWVRGHTEVIENQADIASELAHFLRNVEYAFGFDDANGKPSEPGDVLRTKALTDPAAILIVVPIEDVMAAILNAPMASICAENALCVGFLR